MRIPPYYRHPSWQRFFAGAAIGAILSWFVFLYIQGVWFEERNIELRKQEETIEKLEREKKIWQEDFIALNKKNKEQLTVQNIKVKIINWEKYKLDTLSVYETEESIKDDIDMMIAKDLEQVFKTRDLIKKVIENKTVKLNDKRYKLKVKEVWIYTTLHIYLEVHLDG